MFRQQKHILVKAANLARRTQPLDKNTSAAYPSVRNWFWQDHPSWSSASVEQTKILKRKQMKKIVKTTKS
jgi:hypothetical protein